MTNGMSTLSQKSATVAEFGDCHRCLAVFCDSRTFLRQCGQGLTAGIIDTCMRLAPFSSYRYQFCTSLPIKIWRKNFWALLSNHILGVGPFFKAALLYYLVMTMLRNFLGFISS